MKTKILLAEEASRCMLCYDAPCAKVCPKKLSPDRFVRSVRFENIGGALQYMEGCISCGACERACIRQGGHIAILRIKALAEEKNSPEPTRQADLSTKMCGVKSENPFFLSSSVVASGYDMCARALEAGWAGIVYKTYGTFVPQEVSPRFAENGKEGTPFIGFRNAEQISDKPLKDNLAALKQLKRDFPKKVIVGSIMGRTEEEWTYLAKMSEKAGCDVIECNFSCPHMSGSGMGSDVGTHPNIVQKYVRAVREGTDLPILAKMTPNITAMGPSAVAALAGGANGIAAINTIKSITDVSGNTFVSAPSVGGKSTVSGYSGKAVKPIALRFIHDLKKHKIVKNFPVSGIGGIETWKDALDFLLLGCENVQITTAVMQYGYRIIDDLKEGLSRYLSENNYKLSDIIGRALENFVPADQLDRETIAYPIFPSRCAGCGRCYISCLDGGHQAILWSRENRLPLLNREKCAGCGLCALVCPEGEIHIGARIKKTFVG